MPEGREVRRQGGVAMKKILYFDTETTGLDPVKNDIIQIAGIVEIDGEIVDEFNFTCQPFSYANIEPKALECNGRTIEEIKLFDPNNMAKRALDSVLGKHCDKFNKMDKFYPAGFNVRFDLDFLAQWFKKTGDNYLGSWINWRAIDPLPALYVMDLKGELSLSDYKLGTVCNHYGIDTGKAHDALSDVRATRELIKKILLKG
jgi:DNA polymerase-3 subunit epsilon